MNLVHERLEEEVSSWPGFLRTLISSRRGSIASGKAEVGHVHFWGDVDIPFPGPLHDFLLEHNLAQQHRWVPDSGWTTFQIRRGEDVEHAICLMRLSYLRYALKSAENPASFLAVECAPLRLKAELKAELVAALARFIPAGTVAAKNRTSCV